MMAARLALSFIPFIVILDLAESQIGGARVLWYSRDTQNPGCV